MKYLPIVIIIILIGRTGLCADKLSDLENRATTNAELVQLGDLYLEAQSLILAADAYKKALKNDKDDKEAKFGLIKITIAEKKFDQAKKKCRALARRNKNSPVGNICEGQFWLSNNRSSRAMDEMEKAVKKGDLARGNTGKGDVYRLMADYASAIKFYKKAIQAGASYRAYTGLGLAYSGKQQKEDSIKAFKKAISLQPASCMAFYYLAKETKNLSRARELVDEALAIRPKWSEALIMKGNILLKSGKYDYAATAFNKAISYKGSKGLANLGLGKALYHQKQLEDSILAIKEAIKLVPSLYEAYLLLAEVEYDRGVSKAALDAVEMAQSLAPGNPIVSYHTGHIYFRMKRYTPARSFLMKAVSAKKNYSLAHVLLGEILCMRRLWEKGQNAYDNALAGDMEEVSAKDVKALKAKCIKKPLSER